MIDHCISSVHQLLLNHIPLKSKKTPSGWTSFNCPMCGDRRMRGGLIVSGTKITYRCFNCPFRTGWSARPHLGRRFRQLAEKMGASTEEIQDAQLMLLKHSDELAEYEYDEYVYVPDEFPIIELPEGAMELMELAEDDPLRVYAADRDILGRCPLFYFPNEEHQIDRKRVYVPFLFNDELIGWTGRHINPPTKQLKYKIRLPRRSSYFFNVDKFTNSGRTKAILVEGVFDAVMLDCMAILSNEMSEWQLKMISRLQQEVIVVPDLDAGGLDLLKQCIKHDLTVSVPNWHKSCKDSADACARYGRLATASSIISNATTNYTKAEVQMNLALQERGI